MAIETWDEEFRALIAAFLKGAGARLEALRESLREVESPADQGSALADLRQHFHRLSGAAGTYGFRDLAELAREGERLCGEAFAQGGRLDRRNLDRARRLVDQLATAFEAASRQPEPPTRAPAPAPVAAGPMRIDPPGRRAASDILVIDDDPETVAMLTMLLSQQEWTVRTASTCTQARREMGFQMPAGLIVDILLPDGLGYEIVRHVRAMPGGDKPVILMVSKLTDFLDHAEAIQAGADACFEKPLDLEAIAQKLHHLIEHDPCEPQRVLVVEDDESYAAFVRAVLEGAGYQVAVCAHPRQFGEQLASFRPDVLVMDIGLPDVNGYDLTRYVRQLDQFATLPIVFLTGDLAVDARIKTVQAGGDDFLVKPVHPSLLVASVAARIERARFFRMLLTKDGLTRLLTHTCFLDEVHASVERRRRDPDVPVTLAMIDIDRFKTINDTYGHQAGDRVLVALAGLLRRNLRRSDVVGRYGGEEFALLLDHIGVADASHLIERLLDEFKALEMRSPEDQPFSVTFSAGVAQFDPATMEVEQWIRAADAALYEAKNAGRCRVAAHRPVHRADHRTRGAS